MFSSSFQCRIFKLLTLRVLWLFYGCSEESNGDTIGATASPFQCLSSEGGCIHLYLLLHTHVHEVPIFITSILSSSICIPKPVDLMIFQFCTYCPTVWFAEFNMVITNQYPQLLREGFLTLSLFSISWFLSN